MPARSKFSLLSQPPQPIPEEEPPAPAADSAPRPLSPRAPGGTERARAPRPPAATTIRLWKSGAERLQEGWLSAREQLDPTLSYPQFATMIVMRGLDDYEREREGSA